MARQKKKITRKTRQKKSNGESERALLRSLEALDLKCAGVSYSKIGEQLGVSKKQAWSDVQGLLTSMVDESHDKVKLLRELENTRLDMILMKVFPTVVNQNPDKYGVFAMNEDFTKAFELCLKVIFARIRLNGLNAAPQAQVDAKGAPEVSGLRKVINVFSIVKRENPAAYDAFVKASTGG